MSLATRVRWYLDHNHIDYEVIHHEIAMTALAAGLKAHVPPGRVAKCVLLEDERGYVLAVLPAACRLKFGAIDKLLKRELELATEHEIDEIFSDCAFGAVPATGGAYNVPMLVDESLMRMPDVYFEGGDHEDFVHVDRGAFKKMMGIAWRGKISRPN